MTLTRSLLSGVTESVATSIMGGKFSPDQVQGLAVWWDASDTSTVFETGGSVSQWNDKGGGGFHLSQSTGSLQPVYTGNGIQFDGVDDILVNTTHTQSWTDFTWFGAFSLPSGYRGVLFNANTTAFKSEYSLLMTTSVTDCRVGGEYISFGAHGKTFDGRVYVVSWRFDTDANETELWFDDSLNSTRATTSELDSPRDTGFRLGGSSTFYSDATVHEIVMYNTNLGDSEVSKINQYLMGKWGA